MRTYLTYFVSSRAKSPTGGFSRSRTTGIVTLRDTSMSTCVTADTRLPGLVANCCPSPRSGGSFTVWPSPRVKVSYRFTSACTRYVPRGTCERSSG